jgi:hypothetical protein
MRTFSTFLAVGILALAAGCGSSSSSSSTGYTSPTGRTGSSAGAVCKNQSCAAEDTYFSCLAGKCDAQAKTCFGDSYASGTFAGTCKDYIACNMGCPCDATGTACLAACFLAATTDCVTCLGAVQGCQGTSSCGAQPPTCTSDAATSTGTNCAALSACCPTMAAAAGVTVQQCQSGIALLPDATCAQQLAAAKSAGLCP